MKKTIALSLLTICFAAATYAQRGGGAAQAPNPNQGGRQDALDPSPIDPAKDPNIDLFVGDYRAAKPRTLYGKLVFHDILTKLDGPDHLHPIKRGAVLENITAISYATLDPGATATGKLLPNERQAYLATAGMGTITVNGKSFDLKDGSGFNLVPGIDFKITNTGKEQLGMYVRTEPMPTAPMPVTDFKVVTRFDNDRRVGAHWAHICNGGPTGLNLCTIAPHTMPQPHSHPAEECWIMVKGESILSLGKDIRKMVPGQAYRIPPTGVTAHSNLNLSEEPIQMIFLGPANNGGGGRGAQAQQAQVDAAPAAAPARGGNQQGTDFARLDNGAYNRGAEQDIDMFMGTWKNAFPRIVHGNLYFRDMLTTLTGPDSLHPSRRGAVLTNSEAVSYVMLEPGATAHKIDGELKGIQETFIVNSGTGVITSGTKTVELSKDMAFIISPGLDFKLKATGDKYMTFYVVSEKLTGAPKTTLEVVDNRTKPQVTNSWVNKERPLITKEQGLVQYAAVTQVEQGNMSMSRPYSAAEGVEEIWIATEGEVEILLGKELRKLPVGSAYRVPSTGITAHAKINVTGKPVKFISMVK